jgi:5-methylcytosine-specific restriction endonuclease McrA
VPVSRGGSNDISNIVLACPSCNLQKGTRLPHEWPEGGRLL